MGELKIEELDLYEILNVDVNSPTSEIKKAYRKQALQCHPDKNPDDPNAVKKFHELSKILEILTDVSARAAYDRVLKARKEAALRHKELDSKRRKLKEDLEYREKLTSVNRKTADELLKEEIERLRKEGSRQVQEEIEIVKQQLKKEQNLNAEYWDGSKHRIKLKWTASKNDKTNGGYTQEMLNKFLSKYGDIQVLVMSPKKAGSALVEFKDRNAAEMAVNLEVGLPQNPLKLEWLNGPPHKTPAKSSLAKDSDFESYTLTKLRQAEERKRLIEQMMAEDKET
ncbi:dnaJ homolog subfamily C member 17 [Diorhabda sublineata]|uniref:dnaJ homolog subfamily C member 17 n=1 Tax=Diorhabda sublineata TaxID=1163346 RepID=UPI0024E1862C|nr:dnaJ homolog subfamily C member 17 [Diorhabda sublineata]XP_056634930.1 dnaJ homolog subfamily C member 17 [Diorhabda sublineata]